MNTLPTMKLIALLSRLAALGLATFIAGLLFDSHALGLFAGTVGAFVLLIVAADYAPPTTHGRRSAGAVVAFPPVAVRSASTHNLAA